MPHSIRRVLVLSLLCLAPAALDAQRGADPSIHASARVRRTLNAGWRFTPGSVEFAEKPLVSDAGWERVTIPHTWNARDPFDDVPSYRRGIGWYRTTLPLEDALRGKRLFLYFEGVNQVARVYVNGAFAGEHAGGYTAFAVDITEHVRFGDEGRDNLIAVQVDNAHDPYVPPLSVGFALYGGIYRDVWLVATDPVHFDVTDHASSGVFVSTPRVSRERAEVQLRGTVANDGPVAKRVRVVTTVVDRDEAAVARASSSHSVPARGEARIAQRLPAIANPHLWSPDDPYLYHVVTDVYDGETLLDRVRNPLGLRWFRFDPARGFFLNGEHLQLRGTNRHQDFAGLGSALSNRQHVRDLEWIKEMGANFLRLAHYPQDPAVLEAADRLGLLVWEEIPVVNYITPAEPFYENARRMMREMIRQHHNHPSVVIWGLMNEVFLWSPEGARIREQNDTTYMRQVRDFAVMLDSVARAEDPSRYTAMAIHGSGDYDRAGLAGIPQVLGLNLYSGWYGGEFEGFGATLDRRHERHPEQVVLVSEYGAGSDLTLNSLAPERFDHSSTWHRLYHESYLRQIRARPWLAGTAIWNQFDFSQPHVGESMPNMNQKGMLTFDRRPKDAYYLYQANWTPEPMVYIASRDWTHRAGTDSAARTGAGPVPVRQPVDVYSNLTEVELFANGRSLGARQPDDVRKASWEVPFVDGENVLEARGVDAGGKAHTDRLVVHFDYLAPALAEASVRFRELAVNVGSNAQFADADGLVWVADQPYREGGFGRLGGERKLMARDVVIVGTKQPAMYVTYAEGLEGYRFDVPDGAYEIELRFAEPAGIGVGERVFDVTIGGEVVLAGLDLAARTGTGGAYPVTLLASATDGAGIVVGFRRIAGAPVLNAIRIRRR